METLMRSKVITSNYANVQVVPGSCPPKVKKIIHFGSHVINTQTQAEWANKHTRMFRNSLREVGVPLVEPYTCHISTNNEAIHVCPYAGENLEILFQGNKKTAKLLVRVIVAMQGLLTQENPNVGFDARLSNMCLQGNEIVYIDTFPPIYHNLEEGWIVHFPNPTDLKILEQEIQRKVSPLGIIRRLNFDLVSQGLSGLGERELLIAIKSVMGASFHEKVCEYFSQLPYKQPFNKALELLDLSDPDGIREVAMMTIPSGSIREEYVGDIFKLSSNYCYLHYPDLGPHERMSKILDLIRSAKNY